jgi:hypothetical protein
LKKNVGKWNVESHPNKVGRKDDDKGLIVKDEAKHHAISASLEAVGKFDDRDLVVQ